MSRWTVLALARIRRAPLRSLATLLGVAAVATLACAALHLYAAGLELSRAAPGEPLVVMQAGRICPSTSHLPWAAAADIAGLEGVETALAQQVVVSDCKVSTTATTFRGVDAGLFLAHYLPSLTVLAGDPSALAGAPGAALVGHQVARARDLAVGDDYESAGIAVRVTAIIDGPRMQDDSSVWVDHATLEATLPALTGRATLFEVRPATGVASVELGRRIDALLAGTSHTAPFSAHAARVTGAMADTLKSGGAMSLAAVAAGICLLLNASILGLRSAARDLAILRAIGHRSRVLAWVAGLEGALLGLVGGLLGALAAGILVAGSATAVSTEGVTVLITLRPLLIVLVVAVATACGLATTMLPAWWVARSSLRRALGA